MNALGGRSFHQRTAPLALLFALGACTLIGPDRDELGGAGGAPSGGASAAGSAGDYGGTSSGAGGSDASSGTGGTGPLDGAGGTGNAGGNDAAAGSGGTASGGTGGSGATGGSGGAGTGGSGGIAGTGSGGSGGTAGFGPTPRLAGLRLWLRADAGVALDGRAVTRWNNQIAPAPNAYQTEIAARPRVDSALNAPPIVFDGVDDLLWLEGFQAAWSRGLTLYVLASVGLPTGQGAQDAALLSLGRVTSSETVALVLTPALSARWAGVATPELVFGTGPRVIFSVMHENTGTVTLFVNGVPAGIGSAPLPGELFYGANAIGKGPGHFTGTIGEILLYERALDADEREKVDDYLDQRWRNGLRSTPPVAAD